MGAAHQVLCVHATVSVIATCYLQKIRQLSCKSTWGRRSKVHRKSQPAVQTHASSDGVLTQRSSLLADQVGSTREHALGWCAGCGDGEVVPCDARQTWIHTGVILPPPQNIHTHVGHGRRQISFQLTWN